MTARDVQRAFRAPTPLEGLSDAADENTDALMCIALTRHSPSRTPLSLTHASTSPVMLTNARRDGTLNHSSLR